MSKEQIAALNRVLNYAENANCDDLHHPKKFLHDNIFNCPAQDAMRSDVSIVRKFFQHQEARVKDLEETNRITASLLFERDNKIKELEGLLKKIRDDLRMRGDKDSDGITVVNLSCGLWLKINEALGDE